MSGKLFLRQSLRESGRDADEGITKRLSRKHAESYEMHTRDPKLLPGAKELIKELRETKKLWAIATSGNPEDIKKDLEALGIDPDQDVVVTGEDVGAGKPDPEPFLEAARRLGISVERAVVIGDSTWDMLAAARSHSIGIGLLTGGFGESELERAGALRVFSDPLDLREHLEEVITDS